jgi:hypothetical protein
LRLDSAHGTENKNGPVKNPQGTLHFDGEIHMPRGVDDVDPVTLPFAMGCSRLDGDSPFLFQFHGIHFGAHPILAFDLMDCEDPLRVKEDPFSQGRFACIDVSADADVSQILNILNHRNLLTPGSAKGELSLIEIKRGFAAGTLFQTTLVFTHSKENVKS